MDALESCRVVARKLHEMYASSTFDPTREPSASHSGPMMRAEASDCTCAYAARCLADGEGLKDAYEGECGAGGDASR